MSTVFLVPCFRFLFLVYFVLAGSFAPIRVFPITFYFSLVPFLVLFVFFSLCFFTSFIHLLCHRSYLPYFFIVLKHHTIWANGSTTPRILALWVRMGTGGEGELVWATAHYTRHPMTFPDWLSVSAHQLSVLHSPLHASSFSVFSILLAVLHLICFFSFFFTFCTSCASRNTFLPSSSECSSRATIISLHFLCHKESRLLSDETHTWLTHFVHVSQRRAVRCINGNSYLNIAQQGN